MQDCFKWEIWLMWFSTWISQFITSIISIWHCFQINWKHASATSCYTTPTEKSSLELVQRKMPGTRLVRTVSRAQGEAGQKWEHGGQDTKDSECISVARPCRGEYKIQGADTVSLAPASPRPPVCLHFLHATPFSLQFYLSLFKSRSTLLLKITTFSA